MNVCKWFVFSRYKGTNRQQYPQGIKSAGKTLQAIGKTRCGYLLCPLKILQQADIREAVRHGIEDVKKHPVYRL